MSDTRTPGQGSASPAATGGHNIWDFLIVTVVILALVVVTVILALHYTKASSTASILGIVVPGFAAAFGITLGYAGGSTAGKAAGKEQGRQEVKNAISTQLNAAAGSASSLTETLRTNAVNPQGSDIWRLAHDLTSKPIELPDDQLKLPEKLQSIKAYLDAL